MMMGRRVLRVLLVWLLGLLSSSQPSSSGAATATAAGAAATNLFCSRSDNSQKKNSVVLQRNQNHNDNHHRGWWLGLGRGGSLQAAAAASSSRAPSSASSTPKSSSIVASSGSSSSSSSSPSSSSSHLFRRSHASSTTEQNESRMPSLFMPEESLYDRYAACLAATEGLRRIRDRDLAEEVTLRAGFGTAADSSSSVPGASATRDTERQINLRYLQNSERVLKALGMSINQFNDLGRQVTQDEKLREKVMEQAYLYRMAATIHMDRMPLLEDGRSRALLQSYRRDKVDLFCESMTEIEQLRGDQIERLKKSLRVDKFPENLSLSDPRLLPFLSPKVRAVIEAFPYQAEEIIKRNGLESDEFNKMLEETRSNPLFRWKVQKNLRKDHHPLHPDQQHPHHDGGGVGGSDPLVGSGSNGPGSSSFRAHR